MSVCGGGVVDPIAVLVLYIKALLLTGRGPGAAVTSSWGRALLEGPRCVPKSFLRRRWRRGLPASSPPSSASPLQITETLAPSFLQSNVEGRLQTGVRASPVTIVVGRAARSTSIAASITSLASTDADDTQKNRGLPPKFQRYHFRQPRTRPA